MKRLPTREQIHDAELKLGASRARTLDAIAQLRASIHARLGKPSTLAWAAGIGLLIGKTMLGGKSMRGSPSRKDIATGGIAAALLSRYGWQLLSGTLLRLWSQRQPARHASAPARPAGDTVH